MKNLAFDILALLLLILVTSFMPSQKHEQTDSKIKIVNKSDLNIDHIYFSPPDKNTWDEDDILGDDDVLEPGESVIVLLECGRWDIKLVLEDGGTCLGYDEMICEHETWEITNADCDGDGREDN
ncbi:MAG: hypothetical protein MUE81_12730 [Thermoflexibacter sp.]|jgi:hypothetical protein|nr:hypothetical protein [Thermoflexibacter sp.]